MNLGDYAGRLLGQCVGQQKGEKWKVMRSHFDPEYSHQASTDMIPIFSKEIDIWTEGLARGPQGNASIGGTSVQDVMHVSKVLALRLIALTMYGEALDEEKYARLMELSLLHGVLTKNAILNLRLTSKWYNMLPITPRFQMNAFQKRWEHFNTDMISHARTKRITCPAERIYKGVEMGQMSKTEYLQTLDEMLFTNIDITGSVLGFIFVNMASKNSFQEKLRAEVVGQKQQESYSIANYVAKQDSLLHYATLESLRISPALSFSPPECTASEKVISGYHIPPKTPTVIDVRRLNTYPELWAPDPDEFRPERFENLAPSRYRYGLLRWGIGPGKCMGKNMADLLLKMTVSAVLERYSLSPAKAVDEKSGIKPGPGPAPTPINFKRI
ncbi:putative cytochrome p450 monooxygenase [Phaeomoniella chlamydospora]|uniref:Putative cytochrome p450 monooxygenase n=1 Tax=Phaeomoniella chlamydospora TaxID=158046 RepID=A0A0G2ETI5_PHACM|nr:putative cytochrome p450 monooxygenase [Phaeomoniella chlamydospora]